MFTGRVISERGEEATLEAAEDFIPIHIRGASIIPVQVPVGSSSFE